MRLSRLRIAPLRDTASQVWKDSCLQSRHPSTIIRRRSSAYTAQSKHASREVDHMDETLNEIIEFFRANFESNCFKQKIIQICQGVSVEVYVTVGQVDVALQDSNYQRDVSRFSKQRLIKIIGSESGRDFISTHYWIIGLKRLRTRDLDDAHVWDDPF
jgi:hypothetical protein